jgi:hypothetical protein
MLLDMANYAAAAVFCDPNQRQRLEHLEASGATPPKIALRARLLLRAADGVANVAIDRHTQAELDLHLIVDNDSTHKRPTVKRRFKRHPRFHPHLIPTGSSWLNMIERWFRNITDKAIRRGSFKSVAALIAAIQQ